MTLVAGVGVAVYYGGLQDPVLQNCAKCWADIFQNLLADDPKPLASAQLRGERREREAAAQDPYRRDK